jgi:hypothetical protein
MMTTHQETSMHLTFYGAAREVTGAMHLLTTDIYTSADADTALEIAQ